MIKVAAITEHTDTVSSRFRIRQYKERLAGHGVQLTDFSSVIDPHLPLPIILRQFPELFKIIAKTALATAKISARIPAIIGSHNADITWISRWIFPGRYSIEGLLSKPKILDVDDMIWFGSTPERMIRIAQSMDMIFAGNQFIGNWFSQYHSNIHVIPTVVDCNKYFLRKENKENDEFIIGWTGSRHTNHYLCKLERTLLRFLKNFPNSRLMIISNEYPNFTEIDRNLVQFHYWSPSNEGKLIQKMDVGLMPLKDDEWSKGKCSLKMLQYMATGIPVIVSPVGVNQELLAKGEIGFGPKNDDEWYQALECLYRDFKLRIDYGKTGRKIVVKEYSLDVMSLKISNLFEDLL
jgi:glycosyltransferase involved in cell wall biosynthesis